MTCSLGCQGWLGAVAGAIWAGGGQRAGRNERRKGASASRVCNVSRAGWRSHGSCEQRHQHPPNEISTRISDVEVAEVLYADGARNIGISGFWAGVHQASRGFGRLFSATCTVSCTYCTTRIGHCALRSMQWLGVRTQGSVAGRGWWCWLPQPAHPRFCGAAGRAKLSQAVREGSARWAKPGPAGRAVCAARRAIGH